MEDAPDFGGSQLAIRDSRSRSPLRDDPESPAERPRQRARRRAVTACNNCRKRKTKCDNGRPSCGFCKFSRVPCVYADEPRSQSSKTDPPNSVLLERLNHVITLLEQERQQRSTGPESVDSPTSSLHPSPEAHVNNVFPTTAQGHSDFTDAGFGQLEIPERAARTVSCESLLRWPVFLGLVPSQEIKSLLLQSSDDADIASPEWSAYSQPSNFTRPALGNEEIVPLCRKFQALILVKNPFMTTADFSRYARDVAENGPGWDGPSCLVLLACALACLATPYQPTGSKEIDKRIPLADFVDKSSAEAYYMAAQKRIGLLHHSLIAVQCYYFAGLFEKFSLRPLKAWSLFHQACIHFQTGIWKRVNAISGINSAAFQHARHFEQRLYWSCVKAECELRAEMRFPSSGLLKFKYPENFPSLSMPEPIPQANLMTMHDPGLSDSQLDCDEEQSWLYYLGEISLRGIMNRILDGFYSRGEDDWNENIHNLFDRFDASYEELVLWRAHLPPQISFDDTSLPNSELAFFLQSRYFACQESLHRPFLYYVLLHPRDDAHTHKALALAQKSLVFATIVIGTVSHPHRFGGIWFNMRRSFTCALVLLAAARSNVLALPPDWQSSVNLCAHMLSTWEAEASDLRWCRQILEGIMHGAYE